MNDEIKKTRNFVKKSFVEKPHFSFGDGLIMYNHSVLVQNIAEKISKSIPCNKTVVAIGALLHDIGKTYDANSSVLHRKHERFNLKVSRKFLLSLNIPEEQLKKIMKVVTYKSNSKEMKIVKDADALALYADKRLYTLYIKWARENKLDASIKRKIDKFSKMNFEVSKKIGQKWFEHMKKDWAL